MERAVNQPRLKAESLDLVLLYASALRERTRSVRLAGRKCDPRIQHTFLGFEVKMLNRRVTCPDITTARFLKIFAALGSPSVRIPYDPTVTARLLPDLERAFETLRRGASRESLTPIQLRRVYARIRRGLERIENAAEGDTGL